MKYSANSKKNIALESLSVNTLVIIIHRIVQLLIALEVPKWSSMMFGITSDLSPSKVFEVNYLLESKEGSHLSHANQKVAVLELP